MEYQVQEGTTRARPTGAAFTVTCSPGRNAAVLARFCRELAREASRIASDLDPGQVLTTGGGS